MIKPIPTLLRARLGGLTVDVKFFFGALQYTKKDGNTVQFKAIPFISVGDADEEEAIKITRDRQGHPSLLADGWVEESTKIQRLTESELRDVVNMLTPINWWSRLWGRR